MKDLVIFMSDTEENIMTEFQNAVDDYIEFCHEVGKEPDKGPFNGCIQQKTS